MEVTDNVSIVYVSVTMTTKECYSAGYVSCLTEVLSCLDEDDSELRAKVCGFVADMLERKLSSENTPPLSMHTGSLPSILPHSFRPEGSTLGSRPAQRVACQNISNIHRPLPIRHVQRMPSTLGLPVMPMGTLSQANYTQSSYQA